MSPEQAKGRAADKRSDVWAFGCVLYEMLTGKRAFGADDVSETLAFILARQPDWSALPKATPVAIRRLLHRSLQKDRKQRLSDIADARLEIDDARSESDIGQRQPHTEPRRVLGGRERLAWGAGMLVAGAIGSVATSSSDCERFSTTRIGGRRDTSRRCGPGPAEAGHYVQLKDA